MRGTVDGGRSYRRALLIRFGGLGDILLATPTVRALAAHYPSIEIDFIVGAGMAPVLEGHPNVRRVLTFDKRGRDARFARFAAFLWGLRRARYDLVVNLHPSAKSHLMAATGAGDRLTFEKRMEVRADTGRVTHAVDDFTKELLPLGIDAVADRSLDFFIPEEARLRAGLLLGEAGVTPETRLLVINPAASRPLNRWPVGRFRELAREYAARPGVRVAVTGAPPSFRTVMDGLDEVALACEVAADTRVVNLAGRLGLKEFGAVLERADAFLTCDTGPMHIGAALETPMVVLSGAADPDRTGPLSEDSRVLIDRALPCVPCRQRSCARGDVRCMENLSVETVRAALDLCLNTPRRRLRGLALPAIP